MLVTSAVAATSDLKRLDVSRAQGDRILLLVLLFERFVL